MTSIDTAKFGGYFTTECFDKDGNLKWTDHSHNLVVDEGLNHILDILFVSATAQIDPWYVLLTDGTPTVAAADTLASHAGWTEITNYDEATRQAYIDVRTNQNVSNTASVAAFTMSGAATVGGAGLASNSTKGGSTGILLCAVAFSGGDRSVQATDIINVTYNFGASN